MIRPALFMTATLLAATSPDPSQAAGPLQRRLQIEAELVREASFTGVERGRSRLVQSVNLQVLLVSDGTPQTNNPLDPDDSRRQLEQAQRTQQKVQAALRQHGQEAHGQAAPADPQAMAAQAQAQAQALMARCGQDRDCLMREATAMSAARVAPQQPQAKVQVQARLEAYGAAVRACEKQHAAAKARDACIADARRQAGGSDESDTDDVVETPYLSFMGTAACQLDATTKIDERTEGSFDDVQGLVPYTTTRKAEGRETDTARCALMYAVLDTRNGRLWTRVLPVLREVPGTTVRAEKGRSPQRSEGLQGARWQEGEDWLLARLQNLSSQGGDRLERPLPGGKLELKLRWKFAAS